MDDLELIDLIGAVILLLLVASVSVIVLAAPEVSQTPDAPESNWSIERVNSTHVTIGHEGGQPVDTDNLTVIVDEYPRTTRWSGNGSGGFVSEGDSTVVQMSDGQDIAVYWTGAGTVRREVLVEGVE